MKETCAIFKRQVGSLFRSPFAYATIALYLLCSGFIFYHIAFAEVKGPGLASASQAGASHVWCEFWRASGWILVLVLPLVSMGSIAGEKAAGTIELLLTCPVRLWQIVVGKYLGLVAFLAAMLAPTGVMAAILCRYGDLAGTEVVSGYLGALLFGAAALSVGVFTSSLARTQAGAGLAAFAVLAVFCSVGFLGPYLPAVGGDLVRYLSIGERYGHLVSGDVGLGDIVYLISFAVFFLVAAAESLRILWTGVKWVQ